jgi:hypothetical protein
VIVAVLCIVVVWTLVGALVALGIGKAIAWSDSDERP